MWPNNEQILKRPPSGVWRLLHKHSDSERSVTLHVWLIVEMEHDPFHVHATFAKGWKNWGWTFCFFWKFSPLRDDFEMQLLKWTSKHRIIPASKWLITMFNKSPKWGLSRVVPLPNGLNGLQMGVASHFLSRMILQAGDGIHHISPCAKRKIITLMSYGQQIASTVKSIFGELDKTKHRKSFGLVHQW